MDADVTKSHRWWIDVILAFPLFATYFVPSHPYPACVYQLKPLVVKVDDLIITVL